MNTIKNFFSWILKWIFIGLFFLGAIWIYTTFFEEKEKTHKTEISEDKKLIETEKEYWDNGKLKSETSYKKSYKVGWKKVKTTLIPHGVAKEYYETGVLKKEDPYVEGNRTGTLKLYREDGSLEMTADYLNNKLHGKMISYDTDGKTVLITLYYENDEEVNIPKSKSLNPMQVLDQLKEGMPYSKARQLILNAGWKKHGLKEEEVDFAMKDVYFKNGWTEVTACAGTGLSPCRYEFEDDNKNILVAITQGECFKEGEICELPLTSWFMEE
jgi:hypothetical protein